MIASSGPADLVTRFAEAWNAHDMAALARLFHDDATFVNRFASYWRGADRIVAGHAEIHASIYRDSTLAVEPIDLDAISDDAAIVHFWTRLDVGTAHPAGPHSVDTLILGVASRRDAEWRFQAMENVTLADPRTGTPILRQ